MIASHEMPASAGVRLALCVLHSTQEHTMLIKRPGDIAPSEITPREVYVRRLSSGDEICLEGGFGDNPTSACQARNTATPAARRTGWVFSVRLRSSSGPVWASDHKSHPRADDASSNVARMEEREAWQGRLY